MFSASLINQPLSISLAAQHLFNTCSFYPPLSFPLSAWNNIRDTYFTYCYLYTSFILSPIVCVFIILFSFDFTHISHFINAPPRTDHILYPAFLFSAFSFRLLLDILSFFLYIVSYHFTLALSLSLNYDLSLQVWLE